MADDLPAPRFLDDRIVPKLFRHRLQSQRSEEFLRLLEHFQWRVALLFHLFGDVDRRLVRERGQGIPRDYVVPRLGPHVS